LLAKNKTSNGRQRLAFDAFARANVRDLKNVEDSIRDYYPQL